MKSLIIDACHQAVFLYKIFMKKEDDFLGDVVNHNKIIIYYAAIASIFFQIINIHRVLATSKQLSTVNNRIYFYFYISLFLVSTIVFFIQKNERLSYNKLYYVQLTSVFFYIYWNLLLNSYTFVRSTNISSIIYVSALLLSSVLLRFKLIHIIPIQLLSFITFLLINKDYLQTIGYFNLITVITSTIFCTIILFFQEIKSIYIQYELVRINKLLNKEQDNLRLGLEKYSYVINETNLLSFDWDLQKNTIIPSKNCSITLSIPDFIDNAAILFEQTAKIHIDDKDKFNKLLNECIENQQRGEVDIRFKDHSNIYTWYHVQILVQTNNEGIATNVISTLLNIDASTRLISNLNKQLSTQIEGTKQYLDHLKDSQEQTKIYRHDMRHSLKLMEQLAREGNIDKLCSYLEQTNHKLDSITPNKYCDNETINLIISSFKQLAVEQDTVFTSQVIVPKDLPISDIEISSLLFNLLENALQATKLISKSNSRFVTLKATYHNKKLLIFVENSYTGTISMDEDGLPVTTKDHAEHGFGIKSITSIVESYNGLYTFETQNKIFYAKIMLSL